MKKVLLGLFACLSLICLLFVGVKTKALDAPSMVNGASIRTTGEHQGLKFSASVSSLTGVTEHGFYVVKGTHTKSDITSAIAASESTVGGDKLLKKEVVGEDLDFHLVIYNIKSNGYDQDITALAYVYDGSEYTFASAAVTRNIFTVATAAFEDPGYEPSEIIDRIVWTSTFELNGGSFATSSFTIGAYNSGSGGTSGITLCTKASRGSGSGLYWYKVSLKQSDFNRNIFTVVEKVVSGKNLDGEKDFDYVIAAYTGSDTTTLTAAFAKTYVYIPSFSAGVTVRTDNNYELLIGSKVFYEADEILPSANKAYYDFGGWYNEPDFSDTVKTVKEGDMAETFYAKFTPINYTLSFDLQGGKSGGESSLDDVVFNVESSAIVLPLEGTMSRTDYTFVEWNTRSDGTGDAITSIPAGSHGNITVYAIWAPDAPVDVDLSAADTAALALVTPTKFVKSSFTAGKFNIDGNTYTAGTEAFASIAAALAAASANDIIYVFAGTYSDNLTIGLNGIQLIGANATMELHHNSSFTSGASTSSIINGTITVSSSVSNFTLRGFEIKKQVTLTGVSTANISNIVFNAGSTDGAVLISAASSNINFDRVYQLGSGPRFIYVKANVNGFTMTNCATLDAATVNLGGSNNIDFVRFGASYESQPYGTIVFRNNYVRAAQSGFYFRNGKFNATTTNVTIENNYFYKTPAAVYLGAGSYAPAAGTTVNYTIQQNTFIDCGSKAKDWDVIVVCTAAKTNVQIHYNAFIDSFKTNTGSNIDYVIKVRSASGTIDCANNYFEGATGPISNVLNATGVSQLSTASSTTTPNTYEDYQIVKISESYYVYGVNLTTSGD